MIFGHFIVFGHFPIEIPIEPERRTHMERKGRRAKTKNDSGTSEPSSKTWEHAKFNILNFSK